MENTMGKTVLEWFEEAKANGSPWADAAIKNTREMRGDERLEWLAGSLQAAIIRAFTWSESPEGHLYWQKIHENA